MTTTRQTWIAPVARRAALVTATALTAFTALSGVAMADTGTQAKWTSSGSSWNDPNDKGGVSVYEKGSKWSNGEDIMGQFIAYGEQLSIFDRHDNDRPAIVKLWVGGSGPAVFYADKDNSVTKFNLSYDEGQTVKMEVCTSDSPKAYCTTDTVTGVS